MSSPSKPSILLLSLAKQGFFDSMYTELLTALRAKARVFEALTASTALEHLSSPDLAAVFVTDAAISERQYVNVCSRLVEYARAGGTVVIGGHFSSLVRLNDMDALFRDAWGLPWKKGAYHRTTYALNPKTHSRFKNIASMPTSYSMKAVSLEGVALGDIVYKPEDDAKIQSHVFTAQPIDNVNEAPVAFMQVGSGFLGFIGDVNAEEGSTPVVLAMCGVSP